MARKMPIKSLFYITHRDNVPSMLQHGILSHAQVEAQGIPFTTIYNSQIVSNRREKLAPDGHSLWHFANLYFQPRNPMLYQVVANADKNQIAIMGVRPGVLDRVGAFVTTGNAANRETAIFNRDQGIQAVLDMWDIINNEWWREEDGSKRKIMAECLVPEVIPTECIHSVFVPSGTAAAQLREVIGERIPIVPEPHMFFQPRRSWRITNTLSLIDGDMFFSQMQTLTISVNTVGVMGKGLASRAKYQFPDVYVHYEDLCKKKILQMGQPALYKREASLDNELAADPALIPNPNANKWFLLFPTKRHWREKSDLAGIEAGLAWIQQNYAGQGIKSLAVPALGCGLGGLDWRDVGPLMCRSLAHLDIQVSIYLPREVDIPRELLTREFLLH